MIRLSERERRDLSKDEIVNSEIQSTGFQDKLKTTLIIL